MNVVGDIFCYELNRTLKEELLLRIKLLHACLINYRNALSQIINVVKINTRVFATELTDFCKIASDMGKNSK